MYTDNRCYITWSFWLQKSWPSYSWLSKSHFTEALWAHNMNLYENLFLFYLLYSWSKQVTILQILRQLNCNGIWKIVTCFINYFLRKMCTQRCGAQDWDYGLVNLVWSGPHQYGASWIKWNWWNWGNPICAKIVPQLPIWHVISFYIKPSSAWPKYCLRTYSYDLRRYFPCIGQAAYQKNLDSWSEIPGNKLVRLMGFCCLWRTNIKCCLLCSVLGWFALMVKRAVYPKIMNVLY